MNALGKGLASLIPQRDMEDADEALERIESMEVVAKDDQDKSAQTQRRKTPVSVVDDFEELEGGEQTAPPAKPLVTPLSIDPDDAPVPDGTAGSTTTVPVQEEHEDEDQAKESAVVRSKRTVKAKDSPAQAGRLAEGTGEGEQWDKHEAAIVHIPIGDISVNPLQPRRSFDKQEMSELRQSIAHHGMLQPLVVRRLPKNKGYELVAGERRLRAAKELKWDKVPCVVRRDVASDQLRLVLALIENIQRQNLNPIEEATAYQELHQQFGLTHDEIGERVGKSRVSITNLLRVLQLPAEIQRGLIEGRISTGHAKAILMIPDSDKQIRFYKHILGEGLTVRNAETRARRIQRSMKVDDRMRKKTRGRHPLALRYAPALEQRYGYDADVKFETSRSRYDITFRAFNDEEVEELIGRLLGTVPLALDLDSDVMDD
jgi:ParB family transcriptional regulator, chromosome partitioning protein